MNEVVEKLWQLQRVLSNLSEKERLLEVKPESFAEIDGEYQQINGDIERLEQRKEEVSRDRRRTDGQLQDSQEVLKKYQGQLMQVKNQQQYAAAWKEIDLSRKQVKELEDAELAQMNEIEEIETQLAERRTFLEPVKTKWDDSYKVWQHSLSDLRAEIASLRKDASRLEQQIPANVLADFQRIYKQRQGIGVALVVSQSCNSCRSHIRPQALQQLRRGELVHCEGCRRILYIEGPSS